MIRAVLWDFGGVITTSPFEAFRRFEQEQQLPRDFIRGINSRNPDANAWARFERGELSPEAFDREFEREAENAGHPVRGATVLGLLAGDVRPEMVEAVRRCGKHLTTACLTNNFRRSDSGPTEGASEAPAGSNPGAAAPRPGSGPGAGPGAGLGDFDRLKTLFHVVIESSIIGVRKPDPAFYEHALEAVAARPEECVFLDDLGINLKPARALGMHTIKVEAPGPALEQLEHLLQLDLRGPASL